MTFWIVMSILLFIIVVFSAYGPYMGLYGDIKKEKKNRIESHSHKVGGES